MIKRKNTSCSRNQGSVVMDTTRSQPLTSQDSRSESVLVQEMLAVQDLDTERNLLFTNSLLHCMTVISPRQKNPQEQIFLRYQSQLAQAELSLFQLAQTGDLEQLSQLLTRFPLNLDMRSSDGRHNTLMHAAAKKGGPALMDFLLRKQWAGVLNLPNSSGWTPITVMIAHNPSLLRHTLKQYCNQADWNYRDSNGNGYLHYAYFYQLDEELIEQLSDKCDSNAENIFRLAAKQIQLELSSCKDPTDRLRRQYTLDLTSANKQEAVADSPSCNNRKKRWSSSSSPVRQATHQRLTKHIEHPVKSPRKNSVSRSIRDLYRLQDFRIEKLLGRGAFADVYRVIHEQSGRALALKCVHKNRLTHDSLRYAYNEKDMLSRMSHNGLVKFYCCFQNSSYLFLVLELCSNDTLRELISKRPGQLPESYIRLLIGELILVIGYLHSNCVIYRDLKPENIGIDTQGHLKLLDLGLSKEARRSDSICGSYHYLAPEMISRKEHSFGLDWYMLGILLYELVTGSKPFEGSTPDELIRKIAEEEIPSLPFVSLELQNIIKRLVEKDPERRLGWKDDMAEVQAHPWLSGINWERLSLRQYTMSAQFFFSRPQGKDTSAKLEDSLSSPEFEHLQGWEVTAEPLQ